MSNYNQPDWLSNISYDDDLNFSRSRERSIDGGMELYSIDDDRFYNHISNFHDNDIRYLKISSDEQNLVEFPIYPPPPPRLPPRLPRLNTPNRAIISTRYKSGSNTFGDGSMYECEYCSYPFFTKQTLDDHLKGPLHGFNKPYKCLICDRSYSAEKYLKNHYINVHNVDYEL